MIFFSIAQDSQVSGEPLTARSIVPEVDADHPEVQAIVEQAVKDAQKNTITLTPEIYFEILDESVREAEKVMRETKPDGPL